MSGRPVSWRDMTAALALAHVRYWLTVAPRVRAQLRHWHRHADRITDPVLRAHAVAKIREEGANTEAIATLCTLAPRRRRASAVRASVALQVMYDYLDAVTEQPVADPLRDGHRLFRAFAVALTAGERPVDYYRYHPRRDESGYLDALVQVARDAIAELPAHDVVLPIARRAADRFAEAQIRSHAVRCDGTRQLQCWAAAPAAGMGLAWWEWAGGAAASILAVHALLSAAADPRTTRAEALQIDQTYLLGSALTTMLDSLIDDVEDAAESEHRYIGYYPEMESAACRISAIASRAVATARELPHAGHHAMTVAGIAAFYLSDPRSHIGAAQTVTARVVDQLRPLIVPILATFRAWRRIRAAHLW